MSKEEILSKHWAGKTNVWLKRTMESAMQEFADEETAPLKQKIEKLQEENLRLRATILELSNKK